MRDALLAQLASQRALIGALQAQNVALEHAVELAFGASAQTPQGCPHLETEDVGTFGEPETRCVACKQVV